MSSSMLDPGEALDPFVREGGAGGPADIVSRISGVVIRSNPSGYAVAIPGEPDVEAITVDEAARLALEQHAKRMN